MKERREVYLSSRKSNLENTQKLFISFNRLTNEHKKELLLFSQTGSLVEGESLNPTLHTILPNGDFIYSLHYGSNPFEGHRLDPSLSLKKSLYNGVQEWLNGFQSLKHKIKSIHLNCDNCLFYMESLQEKKSLFDIIDTSNLIDHVGILNILCLSSVLLKSPMNSLLKTTSFLVKFQFKNVEEYLNSMIGLPVNTYPTIFGLELQNVDKSNIDTYSQQILPSSYDMIKSDKSRNYDFLLFRKSYRATVSLSPYLTNILIEFGKRLISNKKEKDFNHNPSLLFKILGIVFSQQRIIHERVQNSPPFTFPKLILEKIFEKEDYIQHKSEILSFSKLYGFQDDDQLYIMSGEFNVLENVFGLTPSLFIELELQDTKQIIDSISILYNEGGKKMTISFLLQSSMMKKIKYVNLKVNSKTGSSFNLFFSNGIHERKEISSFKKVEIKNMKFKENNIWKMKEYPLFNVQLLQEKDFFNLQVFLKKDQELKEHNVDNIFEGVIINGNTYKINIPCHTRFVSIKRNKNSFSISLKIITTPFSNPKIYLNHLNKAKNDQDIALSMGMMFNGFEKVKMANENVSILSKEKQDFFNLIDNIQILFVSPYQEKQKLVYLMTKKLGIIGVVFVHDYFMTTRIDQAHEKTCVLDASFILFTMSDINVMQKILALYPLKKKSSILNIDDSEMDILKNRLLKFHSETTNKKLHPEFNYSIAKRCVITPLYLVLPNRLEGIQGIIKERKESGTKYFKEKNYKLALKCYLKAIENEMDEIIVQILQNLSLSYFNLYQKTKNNKDIKMSLVYSFCAISIQITPLAKSFQIISKVLNEMGEINESKKWKENYEIDQESRKLFISILSSLEFIGPTTIPKESLESLKTKGNDIFKAQRYSDAINYYLQGLYHQEISILLSNVSQCYVNLSEFDQGFLYATLSLLFNFQNEKSHHRRFLSLKSLKMEKEYKYFCSISHQLFPNNKEFQ